MIEKEIIWKHIKEHAGAEFYTVRGHSFTDAIRGDCFIPSRTSYLAMSFAEGRMSSQS
jgi:hypothetical protein